MGCFLSQLVAVVVSAVALVAVMRSLFGAGWWHTRRGYLAFYAAAIAFGTFVIAVPPCEWFN